MLSIISFFSFNLEFTNVKKLRAVTFDEFLLITQIKVFQQFKKILENIAKQNSNTIDEIEMVGGIAYKIQIRIKNPKKHIFMRF